MKKLLLLMCLFLLTFTVQAERDEAAGAFIEHNGQTLFLNGINLAWVNFAHDLSNFDEPRFVAALDELAAARGNTLRWWLHTNGSASPLYGDDGKVTGLGKDDIETLRRAADLAYERGILLQPTLWSHDMLNDVQGVPTDANKLMIEDPAYTQAYMDHALIPLVEGLKGHPGIVAWEIFNEPEGVTQEFGWTDQRTTMPYIQQFVNLLAGAIRRTDPAAQITNGSWNMQVLTDVGGFTNFYTDDRLIAAGGDADGTLDFYEVHYYPEWFDETTSPFHNPYSYWELDKPLVVGEFPAKAIADLGMGFRPRRQLRNSMESYEYLYENGYAGALAWMFYTSDHGKMLDAAPGILRVSNIGTDYARVDIGDVDHIPVIQTPIENLITPFDTATLPDYVDLNTVFFDQEDNGKLVYTVAENSKSDLVEVSIADGKLSLAFPSGGIGTSALKITATDSAGHASSTEFVVQVIDPNQGNVALGKTVAASTEESVGYLASYAVDGLPDTRWSSEYVDGQTLDVDLGDVFSISQFILHWEAAYGAQYELQFWNGSIWQTIYAEPAGDGEIDDIPLDESVEARYIRLNGIKRGTEWGFSLWELEVNGIAHSNADARLRTLPPDFAPVEVIAEPAAMDATSLTSFEDDAAGWRLADYWAGGKSMTIATEMASDGTQSLAIQAAFSGTEWMEAGIYTDPAGGADWSAASQIAVDVYVPEGAESFIAQVFTKTGVDWTWANSADTPLNPGEWTTVTADLSALGDASAVNEYGIKIGTSATAFEGVIYVDNVRLLTPASVPEPVQSSTSISDEPVEAVVNAINSVALLDENARKYEKVELIIDIDAVINNPYDPRDIRVDARFTAPSGKVLIVPGFYYQDFTLTSGRVQPTENWSWRVRFTPVEVGEYRYQVLATTLQGTKRSTPATFTAADSDHKGFIRVDARNPRYFAFDDGTPYFPVGENIGWSTGNPLADYERWLDGLSAAGGNWMRVWMAPWGFSMEWIDTGLGNYDRRQGQAYQLDRVIEMSAERDVYIMLSLLNHGQFSETTNPEWDQNPYNAANGGPCAEITCFATDPEANRLWLQRLRYIVARWGYSPHIMTWEWWNEINWSPLSASSLLKPWIERSAALLKSLDPYDHLVTHSGSIVSDTAIWQLDSLDFVQDHQYNMDDLPTTFSTVIPEWAEAYPTKPFLMGEFGSPTEIDSSGVLVHQGLWAAPMMGAAGTGMTWWWDTYIDPLELYPLFTGVANFYVGEDLAAREWQPTTAEFVERARARVYGLQADDAALLWVVSRNYSNQALQEAYNRALRNALRDANRGTPTPTAPQPLVLEFTEIDEVTLAVSDLQPGSYTVEIWDTHAGSIITTSVMEAADGTLTISLPPFSTDLAIKVKPAS